jgi:hypothetical protein
LVLETMWNAHIIEAGVDTAVHTTHTLKFCTSRYLEARARNQQDMALEVYYSIMSFYKKSDLLNKRMCSFTVQLDDATVVGEGEAAEDQYVQAGVRVEVSATRPRPRGKTPREFWIR